MNFSIGPFIIAETIRDRKRLPCIALTAGGTMSDMKILKTKKEINAFLDKLRRRGEGVSPEVVRTTERIIARVRRNGDRALRQLTRQFDRHETIRLTPAQIRRHARKVDKKAINALRLSEKRIRAFHRHQLESSWNFTEQGATLGQIIRPLERVGLYVPGGKASYPSSVLMNAIPAQVAGVRELAITVPVPGGEVNPHVMAAIDLLGIKEVYAVGGAQAVAALAYGTETIRQVDKIVGPGNIFVATAKRLVFGRVDIDMIAGPSEILVISDESGVPEFIAADLLSQAEHDELASSVLVTDSPRLAEKVDVELAAQLKRLRRRGIAGKALRAYGAIIVVKNLDAAVDIANRIAPEHLEVMTTSPRKLLPELRNAGAIFLGRWTPEPVGDYAAGPNHTLPTGGTARWASPLGVYDFIKRTSLLEFDRTAFNEIAPYVECVADVEGLEAHGNAVRVRRPKRK
jgi:histidinol dehydrogenase